MQRGKNIGQRPRLFCSMFFLLLALRSLQIFSHIIARSYKRINLMFGFDDVWYEAELARSDRSTCKEFRCKGHIERDELRIGIKAPETDHSGDTLGWYHPACLWKTFSYKSNANRPILSTKDIKGFNKLDADDQRVFTRLIEKSKATPTSPQPAAKRERDVDSVVAGVVKLTVLPGGADLECSGDTFSVKDTLKQVGGRWNGVNKSWIFTEASHDKILPLFGLTMAPAVGESVSVSVSSLQQAHNNAVSNNTSTATTPSKYAMAGTISFRVDSTTQDMEIRGDTGHIAHRLTAAGGKICSGFYTYGESWKFPTQSRASARVFFCMPDELPTSMIEIDLSELGRKQAAAVGETITPEQQAAADALLRAEQAKQDAALLSDAREALRALGWGEKGADGETGRGKRTRKGADTPAAATASADKPPAKPLPSTVDELCYESRLDLSKLTIPDFKARLAARGLSTSGDRGSLEARFLLAGAEYQPIQDLAEYTRLANARIYILRNVVPTRASDTIDALLARCNNAATTPK